MMIPVPYSSRTRRPRNHFRRAPGSRVARRGALDYNGRVMTTEDILKARMNGLGHWTGNTPLLAIDLSFDGKRRVLYAKAENLNMTGSIKDRMAYHVLRRGYERGMLKPGAA